MLFFVVAAAMAVVGGAWVTVRRKRKAADRAI
jgi:LPXTG-motif cell wall-anchored protein